MLFRLLILFGTLSFSACSEYRHLPADKFLYLDVDNSKEIEQYGYRDSRGKIVIPFGKYPRVFTGTIREIAFVAIRHEGSSSVKGLYAINKKEEILFQVYPFDNGPDYLSEGLFRILDEEGRIGFANMDGEVVISPRYAYIDAFKGGVASFCDGCKKKTYISNKDNPIRLEGDQYQFEGEEIIIDSRRKYGFINQKGDTVLKPIYGRAGRFTDGIALVFKDKRAYYIDRDGNEVVPDSVRHPSVNPSWIRAYDRVKYKN